VFKLGCLRTGEGKLLMFETVPKLRDERQALRGRQSNDLIGSERFHAFQPAKKGTGGQGLFPRHPLSFLALCLAWRLGFGRQYYDEIGKGGVPAGP